MGDTTQLDELYVAGPVSVDGTLSVGGGTVLGGGIELDSLTVQSCTITVAGVTWFYAAGPPAGTYETGSICWNTAPSPGEAIGWVRIGTAWHRFGTVED